LRPDDQARLAAFEKMLADVQTNYAELVARMDRLKAEKKEKSATFRQYLEQQNDLPIHAVNVPAIRAD